MYITKVKFFNYKRFQEFKIDFNDGTNVLIGDNEAGKSSILQGIDFILSGSRYKVESFGLDNLFNKAIIENFLNSDKSYGKLPKLEIEVYLGGDCEEYELVGKNNSEGSDCSGIKLICAPIDTLSKEIKDILKEDNANFPFEFYK